MRRGILFGLLGALCAVLTFGSAPTVQANVAQGLAIELEGLRWAVGRIEASSEYGAEVNPTGDPIGGGAGYSQIFTTGDYVVTNAEELVSALNRATAGQVVYVAPDAEIDLGRRSSIPIKPGVTLAGNRGQDGAPGPLLYTNETHISPLFLVTEGGRITGLRIRGGSSDEGSSSAIRVGAPNVKIDNNEIYNWGFAGVNVQGIDAHIHHNHIHHVRQDGLGYPVVVYHGTALVEANLFDWYRHAIAGAGYPGTGYEARYNIALGNARSFAFDMHGGSDRQDGTHIAGRAIHIHHNTFHATDQRAVVIRGVPEDFVAVHNNWFLHTDPDGVFHQQNATGNAWIFNNVYGPDRLSIEAAYEQIAAQSVAGAVRQSENLALAANGGSVRVDSSYSGYHGDVLIDGELNDRLETNRWSQVAWASSESTPGERWIEITLAQKSEVTGVSIWWARDREKWWSSSNYVVQAWDDVAEDWVDLWEHISERETYNVYATEIVLVPVVTDKIRILQRVGGGPIARPHIMWVAEVQVWGNR